MNNIFQAIDVTKQYAGHLALNKVSIQVPESSVFGLLGPNGAGKTTLIRIINQITGPDSGELIFKGAKLKPSDIFRIGYLPEERGLYKKMKIGEQALYLAQLKGLKRQDALKRLRYWFEKFEIQGWWNKRVEELSKGMQQKIQFIVTVMHEPELLIFDEPFSGFDPINATLIRDEILQCRNRGATIIFSTHNMASVEEMCDHISLINKSVKILDGPVNEIKKQYRSNTYHIEHSLNKEAIDSLPGNLFNLIETTTDKDIQKTQIKIKEGTTANDLLKYLLEKVEIYSFREVLPSINDIFIQTVRKYENHSN